ncbi:2Fe-2S iron-sulfur cluster-binding protein [Microbacterium aoyamense]|uniref:2Fe-2S iron-sulfur cluster-binding protein n=1 Tax=Microbacterium aoyamense TaxID=344166 RepID=A0ABN2PT03_9MICO|nr:2Fe-2S iron-sulfur cluster-binding protein [Microbacterium aoyamense]
MGTVHMKLAAGGEQDIDVTDGETIMRAATRQSVPGIEGECGGEMSCATCHVYMHAPWKEMVRSASEDEEDLLSADDNATDDSRLSCQIKMKPELDGMELHVVNFD